MRGLNELMRRYPNADGAWRADVLLEWQTELRRRDEYAATQVAHAQEQAVEHAVHSRAFASGPYTVVLCGFRPERICGLPIVDLEPVERLVQRLPLFRNADPAEASAVVQRAVHIEPEAIVVGVSQEDAVYVKRLLEQRRAKVKIERSLVKSDLRRRQSIPEQMRREVWRRDEGRCVDCGSRENLEFDHIIPVSQGGSNTVRNIELRCEPCNRRKAARI